MFSGYGNVQCQTRGKKWDGRDVPIDLTGAVMSYSYTQCPNNGDATRDPRRAFTASYLNLTRFGHGDGLVNWISAQSRPPLRKPYSAGAATSELMRYLEPAHYEVQITRSEKQRVACWIDLCVPFCGSHTEAHQWEPQAQTTYLYFESKRRRLAEIDNLRKLVAARTLGETFTLADFEVFDRGSARVRREFEESWLKMNVNASRGTAAR